MSSYLVSVFTASLWLCGLSLIVLAFSMAGLVLRKTWQQIIVLGFGALMVLAYLVVFAGIYVVPAWQSTSESVAIPLLKFGIANLFAGAMLHFASRKFKDWQKIERTWMRLTAGGACVVFMVWVVADYGTTMGDLARQVAGA